MAALDTDSFLHFKEARYTQLQSQGEGHQFMMEALRTGFMEGKVGMRESVAIRNLPPERDAATAGP